MFEHFYYTSGNYHICYNKQATFQCSNSDNQDHINRGGVWRSGDYVRNEKEIKHIEIDKNITKVLLEITRTKLQKGVKCNCPVCNSPIEFIGWRVWVENVKNKKIIAGLFQTGTKTIYTKYCKTLKNRRATIERLLKKYKEEKDNE